MNDNSDIQHRNQSDLSGQSKDADLSEDPLLFAALQEYIALAEAGNIPHRREFLAKYPDIREVLANCLDGQKDKLMLLTATPAPNKVVDIALMLRLLYPTRSGQARTT